MKKIKYLIGAFIFWFWLLINHTFSYSYQKAYVEAVTLPLLDSSFSSSSNYLYTFVNESSWVSYESNVYNYFVYSLFYDWLTKFNYQIEFNNSSSVTMPYSFNDSAFNTWLYYSGRFINATKKYLSNQNWAYTPIKLAFWNWVNQWKSFIYTNILEPWQTSPKYAFWNWFFYNNLDYSIVSFWGYSNQNFLRLFYNQNINLSIPLDWYDHIYATWSNMLYNSWTIAFMEMTQSSNSYQTNYNSDKKYIVDYGSQGVKWLSFGGYWVWYTSPVYFSNVWGSFSWSDFSFSSLWSRCLYSAMQLWVTDFNSLTSNNCLNLWLLVLKWDTYVSRQNNSSVIILWKNPNNYSQILYEQFDCAEDDLSRIFNTSYCNSIWHWYITVNWSSNILPFLNSSDLYYLWSWNSFLDFMFNQGVYWYVSIDTNNNQYCLNSSSSQFCFWLHNTPNLTSLKELYLDWIIWDISTWSSIIPFSSLYYQCLGPSYNTPDWLPPAFCLNPDWTLINLEDYQDCYFTLSSSWDLMENLFCNNNWYVQEMAWIWEGSWGSYVACYWEDCGVMFSFGPNYLIPWTSFELSTWLIEDMFTNITGWVGRCPFPYTDFQLWKDSEFLKYLKSFGFKYDPFIIVNCTVAWFHHWRHIIDNTLFWDTFNSPLLNWDTPKHRALFGFLDFIVILWLFGLFSFIKRIF